MFRPVAVSYLALLTLLFMAAPSLAQTEKIIDTETDWIYYFGASSAEITSGVSAGWRPFSLERVGSDQYDAISVANSGPYQVPGFGTGNLHFNRTLGQLSGDLAGRRIVSLDCFPFLNNLRMNAVTVPNPGGTGWGWLVDQSAQGVVDWITDTTPALRVVDLSIYTINGEKRYAAVAVANQGSEFQNWWWYLDKTEEEIVDLLTENRARLIDIELETAPSVLQPAKFACVMVAENPGAGWVFASLSSDQVNEIVGQTGGRLTNLHRYTSAIGLPRYAVSLVDNANAQTRRMRGYMAEAATTGSYGFKLKQVGGPVLASLHENFVYEPASSLKILHATYSIFQAAVGGQGSTALEDEIWVPNRCGGDYWNNVCPETAYNCDSDYEPLSTTMRGMMRTSHNGRTHTIEELFGRSVLNDFAQFSADLSNTRINHTLGCLCEHEFNTTTAADMTKLYEQISDGTHFDSGWRDTLLDDVMANLTDWGYGSEPDQSFYTLGQVINEEAAGTNLTPEEITTFRDAMRYAVKGGAYGCDLTTWRSSAGLAGIPFKVHLGNWVTLYRNYAVTTFVHGGNDPGSKIAYAAADEILREQIREALATWDAACEASILDQPDDLTVNVNEDAQFEVVAGGAGSASYQWQRQVGILWVPVEEVPNRYTGTTTDLLTIHRTQPDDAGKYRCRIIKTCGHLFSDAALLTVDVPASAPETLPTHLVMYAPTPNPFNPHVTLRFDLPHQTDRASLDIFDVAGRRMRSISTTALSPGSHEFKWDGTDESGRRVSTGTYLARLRIGDEQAVHRLMLVE